MSPSRTPHGVRGLKLTGGVWSGQSVSSRTPHGVRGLKFAVRDSEEPAADRRTPHGVRGLKSLNGVQMFPRYEVAPLTGCVD